MNRRHAKRPPKTHTVLAADARVIIAGKDIGSVAEVFGPEPRFNTDTALYFSRAVAERLCAEQPPSDGQQARR